MRAFRVPIRQMRQLVWLTLLAWLFALAAGVANACVLGLSGPVLPSAEAAVQGRAAHHGADDYAQDSATPHEQELAQEQEQELQQDQEQDPGKTTCLKFCDDESTALSKSKTYGAEPLMALVELRDSRGMAVPVKRIGRGVSLQRPVAPGPPLAIRFLRLTL